MNLKELTDLGVRELSVSNGQAVAVNPYDAFEPRQGEELTVQQRNSNVKHWAFIRESLPPLPCAESVKEGTYPIGRFSELPQWYDDIHEIWREDKNTATSEVFETRIALILKDQTADEYQKEMDLLQADIAPFKEQEDSKQKRKQVDQFNDYNKLKAEPVAEAEKEIEGVVNQPDQVITVVNYSLPSCSLCKATHGQWIGDTFHVFHYYSCPENPVNKIKEQPKDYSSEWFAGNIRERFKELEAKGWDWRSFYNGWMEGRVNMYHSDNLVEVAEKPEGESLQWKPAPFECDKCGSDSEVLTRSKEDWYYYDEEEARCTDPKCGNKGIVYCEDDQADVVWDDDAIPSPPEAEPVESAEEIARKHLSVTRFDEVPETMLSVVLKAMEEYASLRVAQALKK